MQVYQKTNNRSNIANVSFPALIYIHIYSMCLKGRKSGLGGPVPHMLLLQ